MTCWSLFITLCPLPYSGCCFTKFWPARIWTNLYGRHTSILVWRHLCEFSGFTLSLYFGTGPTFSSFHDLVLLLSTSTTFPFLYSVFCITSHLCLLRLYSAFIFFFAFNGDPLHLSCLRFWRVCIFLSCLNMLGCVFAFGLFVRSSIFYSRMAPIVFGFCGLPVELSRLVFFARLEFAGGPSICIINNIILPMFDVSR